MVLPCKFGIANALRARYWLSSGATLNAQGGSIGVQSGTVSFWGMQCEIGYITTVLEKPAPDFELAQCMRWYQSHLAMLVAGYAPTAGNVVIDFTYPVMMRAAPTVTFASIVYSNMSGLSAAIALIDHARLLAVITAGLGFGTATANVAFSAVM
jgi:hypothetical protein